MSKEVATRSTVMPISDAEKAYARTTTRIQVATAVWTLWDRLRKEHGFDQQWLANRMGKNKSWSSRLLKGPGNWTLDTLGDLLEAMGGRLTLVEAHTYDDIAKGKVANVSNQSGSRRIHQINVEIIFDDAEFPDIGETSWARLTPISALRPLALSLDEKVEAA